MAVSTFEGIVENGQIKLRGDVRLPEKARVYIVIPDQEAIPKARIYSPRLANAEQSVDFVKQVMEETNNARL